MASVFDIDMADNYVVNNIIFSNSDSNDKVRDHTLAPSANSPKFVLNSSSNKSEELYLDCHEALKLKIQTCLQLSA